MRHTRIRDLAIIATTVAALAPPALGQLTEFNYSGPTGAQSWQTASNWGGGGFPNDPQHVANLSQALAGDLSIDLGGSGDVTVAGIKIGGTAGAVTTNITSGGATLRFQNTYTEDLANADFSKNAIVNGQDFLLWQRGYAKPVENPGTNNTTGDADLNGTVDGVDLGIWEENFGKNANGLLGGRPQVITGSVAGSVNTITAPIYMVHEIVEVLGPTDLTITGNISFENDEAVADDNVIDSSISSLTRGTTLTLNGTIDLQNKFDSLNGRFGLNTSGGSNGTLVVNSVISDGATTSSVQIGVAANGLTTPLNTVVLNAANTYGGSSWLSRTNLILNDPAALGTGTIRHIGPANQFGYNIIAGDDSLVNGELVLANDMIVGQWQSFRGDNSIRMTGDISQTNNRGFANLLIDGATLTLDGRLNIWEDDEALEREFEIEGSGTTIITGVIR
ncbi:MAG: hypothetical protein KDB68_17865, partial [Planctomycetes bacterium]|nr:hypothetical protein [Planctomycetota bacterium]